MVRWCRIIIMEGTNEILNDKLLIGIVGFIIAGLLSIIFWFIRNMINNMRREQKEMMATQSQSFLSLEKKCVEYDESKKRCISEHARTKSKFKDVFNRIEQNKDCINKVKMEVEVLKRTKFKNNG